MEEKENKTVNLESERNRGFVVQLEDEIKSLENKNKALDSVIGFLKKAIVEQSERHCHLQVEELKKRKLQDVELQNWIDLNKEKVRRISSYKLSSVSDMNKINKLSEKINENEKVIGNLTDKIFEKSLIEENLREKIKRRDKTIRKLRRDLNKK